MAESRSSFRFTSTLVESRNKLWGCHFAVSPTVAGKLTGKGSRRVICTLNRSVEYQCALVPNGKGLFVITVNRQRLVKLGLRPGSLVRVELRKDDSRFGLPMPREFEELLKQEREGKRLFFQLTPGKQRTLLYMIGKPKDSDIRLMRANIILRHLRANGGSIQYRRLAQELKKGL